MIEKSIHILLSFLTHFAGFGERNFLHVDQPRYIN